MSGGVKPGEPFQLITIPISHYCEKIRWSLDHVGARFVEYPYTPPFHRRVTKRYGGTSVPVLITDTQALLTSQAIMADLDRRYPGVLLPRDATLRRQADDWTTEFDDQLGIATRRWGYSYILTPALLRQPWTQGVPFWQRWAFPLVYGFIEPRLRSMIRITPTSAADSYADVMRVFDRVGQTLADGRRHLLGDQLSAADITFAALAAPILLPPEHHVPLARLDQLPTKMQSEIAAAQATPAGAYGLKLYREHRRVKAA
jgi:glutathione S-transferase